MFERRSLRAPIALGVVMIVLVVVLAAIWIVANWLAATDGPTVNFYVLLVIGVVLLAGVLAGVIAYLTLTVKAFNLNRRQSNFIDSVTHELKSPIASLKLYLQTMSRREIPAAERTDFHRFMLEDVERLDSLINHLLDVARVDRGEMQTPVGAGNVGAGDSLELGQLLRQAATGVCLRYRIPESSLRIDSPEIHLAQPLVQTEILFRNLIDNAVKYGGSPPEVRVSARCENGQALVQIEDNGPGIPANQRRKVFGRFVRLGSELERSRPGTGLGLYLVRNITRSMHGTVRVFDREDGPGSRFEVSLPGAQVSLPGGQRGVETNPLENADSGAPQRQHDEPEGIEAAKKQDLKSTASATE
ncbi:MAG: HAMP domain-containing sensor histidine kinase [Planctomycetota bacterium]